MITTVKARENLNVRMRVLAFIVSKESEVQFPQKRTGKSVFQDLGFINGNPIRLMRNAQFVQSDSRLIIS